MPATCLRFRGTGASDGTRQPLRIALAGDVMIGRGVDQIMGQPGDPTLYETWARSALRYVGLAEEKAGPLPREVDPDYVWGDVPGRLESHGAVLRIANLETAVTERGRPWPGKGIHYRVHPRNAGCLVAGGIDVAVLANNHILDWSEPGLVETLDTLDELGVARSGAGRDIDEAWQPATVETEQSSRVVVLGVGSPSSGVDTAWAAGPDRPGVALVETLSEYWLERIGRALDVSRRPGDVVVLSIHWGPNWGYAISSTLRRFARGLVDHAGVDVVHGHSSHHPLGFEVYRDRLILYGCGDLLNDYEGIRGHEEFRPELGGWYLLTLDRASGEIQELSIIPTMVRRFQLTTPSREDLDWLAQFFESRSVTSGVQVRARDDLLMVDW